MRKDKEKTSEYNKLYRERNKQLIKEKAKVYRQTRAEELRAYEQEYSKTPKGRFVQQKVQARKRGISFELSFDEWWSLWKESGKWEQRGFGRGKFCMARYNDKGPYVLGNVVIARTEDNKGRRV